ncbi:MAG: hypothetical protein ACI8Q1_000042 [Parvicella sp.]|jgi:hypothetical protein
MGQSAPDEETLTSDIKKTDISSDKAWNQFQKTLWFYYYAQWFWIVLFVSAFYTCSQENYSIQQLWLQLSFEPLTQANIYTVSGDYLLILLLFMPFFFLYFTRILKGLIRKPTFSLKVYNISSIIRIVWFVLAGHMAAYFFGGVFLCSMLHLNQSLRKT